jgi:hypothetical protein
MFIGEGCGFNLSQAIADAGSWLQQSFDFMKDSARPSQHLKAIDDGMMGKQKGERKIVVIASRNSRY